MPSVPNLLLHLQDPSRPKVCLSLSLSISLVQCHSRDSLLASSLSIILYSSCRRPTMATSQPQRVPCVTRSTATVTPALPPANTCRLVPLLSLWSVQLPFLLVSTAAVGWVSSSFHCRHSLDKGVCSPPTCPPPSPTLPLSPSHTHLPLSHSLTHTHTHTHTPPPLSITSSVP